MLHPVLMELPRVTFEWTVTAGNLIGGLLAVGGAIASMVRVYTKIDACIHRQAEENRKLTRDLHAENRERITEIEARVVSTETRVNDLHKWWMRQVDRRR